MKGEEERKVKRYLLGLTEEKKNYVFKRFEQALQRSITGRKVIRVTLIINSAE